MKIILSKIEELRSCYKRSWLFFLLAIFFYTSIFSQNLAQWDTQMKQYGLINIQDIDSTILVDLRYASKNNFVGENMYGSLKKAYLRKHFAQKIKWANTLLQKENPDLTLIIFDAARPVSVQKRMYEEVKNTSNRVYVANPRAGGRHNFGVAVDLSIYNIKGDSLLDMGTPFDYFGVEAHVGNEYQLLKTKKISSEALKNRQLLYRIMKKVGLKPYRREWWHYEENMPISEVRKRYPLLKF